jgi:hypothetical protein
MLERFDVAPCIPPVKGHRRARFRQNLKSTTRSVPDISALTAVAERP